MFCFGRTGPAMAAMALAIPRPQCSGNTCTGIPDTESLFIQYSKHFNDAVKLFNRKVTLVFSDKVERCGNSLSAKTNGKENHWVAYYLCYHFT